MSTLEDLAFKVCTGLDRVGVTAVLSGGGAATFYAPEAYQSRDLDFVLPFAVTGPVAPALEEIGIYETTTRGTYASKTSPFTLEFLDGPIAVGDEVIRTWNTVRRGEELLHVITATDSVRDRLSAAIHWKDLSAVKQAAAIALRNDVTMDVIERWCAAEGGSQAFRMLRAAMNRNISQ